MKTLSIEQMEEVRSGSEIDGGCIAGLVGLGFAFLGIFAISGPFGALVWYGATMATAVGTGLSCK